ncbi:HpcH/HpaI aldolase/citrate lyase family protein [Ramlibacter alkalitolerans]|uniref:CoA ester lyase n=1 Tax=Ramlibacter alkalitolerans TaxID=2039631 RepID=A0ABS1JLV8_9BURK|nr:CoA ester lyase [Ramlibacter alkalitolerans]MBL0425184.1 CoA ester lyase [Ramlibacter alkalitolerans]
MRSKLFVPASRPELFAKALAGAADAVSFDLEDAVEEGAKPAARTELVKLFQGGRAAMHGKLVVVRVNAVETSHFAADLEAIACEAVDVLNLPMVESAATVRDAVSALERIEQRRSLSARIGILANIESARGLRLAAEIATAHPRVMGLQIGFGDLFSPLGIPMGEPFASQAVRFAVRLAAGEAGIAAYDGAYVDIRNPDGFVREAKTAQQMGFAGKSCIHPTQIALANDVFRPSQEEIAHALRVVEAARDALARGVGAFTVDGKLVDGPFITRAEHLVALARRLGLLPD